MYMYRKKKDIYKFGAFGSWYLMPLYVPCREFHTPFTQTSLPRIVRMQ
jgi:hypothetical protein